MELLKWFRLPPTLSPALDNDVDMHTIAPFRYHPRVLQLKTILPIFQINLCQSWSIFLEEYSLLSSVVFITEKLMHFKPDRKGSVESFFLREDQHLDPHYLGNHCACDYITFPFNSPFKEKKVI